MCPEIFLFDHEYGSVLRIQETRRCLFFCDMMLRHWVIGSQCSWTFGALKMRALCCLETSGINHSMTGIISQNSGHFIYTTAKCNNLHDNLQ